MTENNGSVKVSNNLNKKSLKKGKKGSNQKEEIVDLENLNNKKNVEASSKETNWKGKKRLVPLGEWVIPEMEPALTALFEKLNTQKVRCVPTYVLYNNN